MESMSLNGNIGGFIVWILSRECSVRKRRASSVLKEEYDGYNTDL